MTFIIDTNYNNCLLALYICITLQNDDFTHTKIMETNIHVQLLLTVYYILQL